MFVDIDTLSFYAVIIVVVSLFTYSSFLFLPALNLYCIFFYQEEKDKNKNKLQSQASNSNSIIQKGMMQLRRAKNPRLKSI